MDQTNSTTMRATLHDVIDDHQRFPYTSGSRDTWDVLEDADEDPNNASNILDVYRNASYTKVGGGTGPYNREHSSPKSYGFPIDNSSNYPYTDCHHLLLCYSGYSSSRSNRVYDTCDAACTEKVTEVNNGQGGGSGTYPGNSNCGTGSGSTGTWETWNGRRGEVARAAGTDLSGWQLVGYNGNGDDVYKTVNISGTIPDQQNGSGTLWFAFTGLQNGAPDGIALVDDFGAVIEFLSYEGVITAVDGPANGMTSIDIGVSEGGTTPKGDAMQLEGTGNQGADFTWASASPNTRGSINNNQTFSP